MVCRCGRAIWDAVITVGAIGTALISCWSAGFAIKHPSTPLFAVELVIDILFMMDVLLNFNTGAARPRHLLLLVPRRPAFVCRHAPQSAAQPHSDLFVLPKPDACLTAAIDQQLSLQTCE